MNVFRPALLLALPAGDELLSRNHLGPSGSWPPRTNALIRSGLFMREVCQGLRFFLKHICGLGLIISLGCGPRAEPEIIYGRHGVNGGQFVRPRAVAIDAQDRVYIVDFTARIQ